MAEDKEKDQKEKSQKIIKKARTVDKWKKKTWFQLIAPPEFDKKVLGETIGEKPKNLVNRIVEVNLDELTGQKLRRHINVLFKVADVEGNQAKTVVVGHYISESFMNRLVRRRMSKVELTQTVETSDGKKVKVKSVALSMRKLKRRQQAAIVKEIADKVAKGGSKKTFNEFSQEIIFGVFASKLFKQMVKIAPLKRFEIVKSRLLETQKQA